MLKVLAMACAMVLAPAAAWGQSASGAGADDFDWELGLWDTQVQVRSPLDPDGPWSVFDGTSDVRPLSDGRANTVDLALSNASGARIEGVALRLFSPQSDQWSINFASMNDGLLTAPVYGAFTDGRGEFYGQDTVDGRIVMVRFVISEVTDRSARFVQSYSADGGQNWIDNWIATDTRRDRNPDGVHQPVPVRP